MKPFTCAAVVRRIPAFHDRELPVGDHIAVATHIQECPPCAKVLRELQSVGDALRAAAAPAPADDWTGLQPGVISRMRAEAHESWPARAQRLFDDMHLVWIALASAVATFLCSAIVLGMLHFASPERADSLAATMAVVSAPWGSDLNPATLDGDIRVPSTVPGDDMIQATLAGSVSKEDVVLPLSVIITREGRVLDVSVLGDRHGRDFSNVLDALSRTRLQPAQAGGAPVAVSLVWLLAHTTVRGKISS
jgi:anti-sigma factor RsiW